MTRSSVFSSPCFAAVVNFGKLPTMGTAVDHGRFVVESLRVVNMKTFGLY